MEQIDENTRPDYTKYGERLNSFNEKSWPTDSPVYIKELVEAGFVYTGDIDLVFCFKCGITESNWLDNENPMERHTNTNPNCPYMLLKQRTNIDSAINNTKDLSSMDSLKSFEDFEREDLLYDWFEDRGIVQRKVASNNTQCDNRESLKECDDHKERINSSKESLEDQMEELTINLR